MWKQLSVRRFFCETRVFLSPLLGSLVVMGRQNILTVVRITQHLWWHVAWGKNAQIEKYNEYNFFTLNNWSNFKTKISFHFKVLISIKHFQLGAKSAWTLEILPVFFFSLLLFGPHGTFLKTVYLKLNLFIKKNYHHKFCFMDAS